MYFLDIQNIYIVTFFKAIKLNIFMCMIQLNFSSHICVVPESIHTPLTEFFF